MLSKTLYFASDACLLSAYNGVLGFIDFKVKNLLYVYHDMRLLK